VVSVLSWWRYTFQLVDGELVVTSGVLRIDRLTVATGRIQSIAIEQELLHRLTDVVKVVVTTAGTAQAEFTIDAVARPVAEELRRQATALGAAGTTSASGCWRARWRPAERVVFQHTPRRLAVAALTMSPWAGLALIPPLWFGLQQALEPVADDLSEAAPDLDVDRLGWWLALIVVIVAPLFVVLLNLGRVYFADWQQELRTDSTTLRRTSGLLSRFSTSSSVARVQVMTSRQNWLQRRAGIRDVHLSNAGDGDLRLIACRDEEFAATAAGCRPHPRRSARARPTGAPGRDLVACSQHHDRGDRGGRGGAVLIGWWAMLVLAVVPWVWWRCLSWSAFDRSRRPTLPARRGCERRVCS
jgi:uncharacterized membrane protein YdbT with pleckstrin-like domain